MITTDDVRAEIGEGEGSVREFKSTYRWNVKAGRLDEELRLEVLKAIAGFLNSESGGVLLIGVEDNGRVFGIDKDTYKSADAFILAVLGDAKNAMGADVATYLEPSVHELDGKTVCRVQCWPSAGPTFLKFGGQEDLFFVRTGPMTTKLKPSEIHRYVQRQWPVSDSARGAKSPTSEDSKPFYLTEILKSLGTPTDAIRSLAIDVASLQREGKLSFTINTGPCPELSEALKHYEARLAPFRQTVQTTRRVLTALSGRDFDEAKEVKGLLSALDTVMVEMSALAAVRDRVLKGAVTTANLEHQPEIQAAERVADAASEIVVRLLYPEPKVHIFLRGEMAYTPKSETNDRRSFALHFKVINTGPKSTNEYKVEAEIPTMFVASTRPTAFFDQARTTAEITYLRYPISSGAALIFPGKPESVMDLEYEITARQLADASAMDKRVVFRVYQPDGGYTESSRTIDELHNCFVDQNGTIHTMPTLSEIEAQFRRR